MRNEWMRQQVVRTARLQAWAMSFVCVLLTLFAITAATRIPDYWAEMDYVRLIGVVLFGLLVLAGIVDNIRTHICIRRLQKQDLP